MLNVLKNLFFKEVSYKSTIPFSNDQLAKHIRANRNSLQLVDNWIDEEAFSRSYFKYGVPDFLKPVINKPIGEASTYTDLMTHIAERYFQQINYPEIGVSVGK